MPPLHSTYEIILINQRFMKFEAIIIIFHDDYTCGTTGINTVKFKVEINSKER